MRIHGRWPAHLGGRGQHVGSASLQDGEEGTKGRADACQRAWPNHVVPFLVHQQDYAPQRARRCCSHQDRGTRECIASLRGDTGYAHLYSDPKGDSIHADSVDIPIVLNTVGIVTILPADGALPLCSAHDVDFWIEPRAKKINVPLACPAWSVRTIKDASKSTMTVSTWVENFTWKHQRFDPRDELSLKLNIYQLKLKKGAALGPLMQAGHVELARPHISQAAKCVKPRMVVAIPAAASPMCSVDFGDTPRKRKKHLDFGDTVTIGDNLSFGSQVALGRARR